MKPGNLLSEKGSTFHIDRNTEAGVSSVSPPSVASLSSNGTTYQLLVTKFSCAIIIRLTLIPLGNSSNQASVQEK